MKPMMIALKMMLFMTVLTGLIYPLLTTGISQLLFPDQANGSLMRKGTEVIGSELLAQKFEAPEYFWERPSAVDYNPLPSGGANLGPTSQILKEQVTARRLKLMEANRGTMKVPPHLLFASGSGLDPHISVEAARYQFGRIAKERNLNEASMQKLLDENVEGRQWGFLGEPRVNVLKLNLALDILRSNLRK